MSKKPKNNGVNDKNKDKEVKEKDQNKPIEEKEQKENIETAEAAQTPEEEDVAEPVTGAQRFFRMFDKFGDLFVLNVYFFVTCVPLITIGPSFIALYTVTNKMVKDKEGPIRQEYFKAFKANLKQGIAIWIIDIIAFYAMYLQYAYIVLHNDQVTKWLYIILGFEFVLFAFAFPLQWPMVARYENTTWALIRNSLIFSLTNLGTWFKMFYIWLFPVVLYFLNPKIFVYTWFLWGLVLTAMFAYTCSMFLVNFYERLENPEAVEKKKAEKKANKAIKSKKAKK